MDGCSKRAPGGRSVQTGISALLTHWTKPIRTQYVQVVRWSGLVGDPLPDPSCTGHRKLYGKSPYQLLTVKTDLESTGAVAQEKTVFASAEH